MGASWVNTGPARKSSAESTRRRQAQHEAEAWPAIQAALGRGLSYRAIARFLNDHGVVSPGGRGAEGGPTGYGEGWSHSAVARIVQRRRGSGIPGI